MKIFRMEREVKDRTALKLFLTLLFIVFLADMFANVITNAFSLPVIPESIVDAALIILFAYPALYLMIFRPLSMEVERRIKLEKMKDEFIGTVSHELRTPLSITKEGISLIMDKVPGPVNEQQAHILTVSKNNIDRLTRIINSLLDMAKIEAGKAQTKREVFRIIPLVRQVVSAFELKTTEKGLRLNSRLPDSDAAVCGDTDAIAQVLTNLLGNACRFTHSGSIDVSVEELGESVEISVSDTGIGIAREDMPKLFQKFQQFRRVNGPGEKGTGLGLAIAKGIVETHKGRIWAESEVGKGTKVTFTLPKKIRKGGRRGEKKDTGRG